METNRRGVLRLLTGFAMGAAGVTAAMALATKGTYAAHTEKRSPPSLDGELSFDEKTLAAAADDFGHIMHRTPKGVLLPASAEDVAATVRWATAQGYKVAAQGQGHSVYGRAQVRDGIVIDMTYLRTVHCVEEDRIVVDAGAKWSEVLAATLPKGLTPPVLTEYLELSVGGTLIVGGIGVTTSRYGMQSDNILELNVVTGQGEQVTCSQQRNADLFHAVRAGLGQVGIITSVTLKLISAPEQVRQYVLSYPNLKTLLKDERLLTANSRFDDIKGALLLTLEGRKHQLTVAAYFSGNNAPDDDALLAGLSDDRAAAEIKTLPYAAYANRFAMLEKLLRENGQWFNPHPWLMTFVGDTQIEAVVSNELTGLKPADLGEFGQIVLSPFRRESVTSPLLRLPADDIVYAFNLVRIPITADTAEAGAPWARLVKANRAAYERIRAAGGMVYPVSAFPMSSNDWRQHFGSAWTQLRDAKQKFDPEHVLTPGYELFQ